MYREVTSPYGVSIVRISDGTTVSSDPGHPDRIAYQEWLDEGNTPEQVSVVIRRKRLAMASVIERATESELALIKIKRDEMMDYAEQQAALGNFAPQRFMLGWEFAYGNTIDPENPQIIAFFRHSCGFTAERTAELLAPNGHNEF